MSSDKTKVAFVGTNEGGQDHLYVASLSAYKSPPRQLLQFDGNLGGAYGMLDWLP